MTLDEAYRTLGIEHGSSPDEAKRAFREAASWCHPDKNSGNKASEEAFKRLCEARDIICGKYQAKQTPNRANPSTTAHSSPPPHSSSESGWSDERCRRWAKSVRDEKNRAESAKNKTSFSGGGPWTPGYVENMKSSDSEKGNLVLLVFSIIVVLALLGAYRSGY